MNKTTGWIRIAVVLIGTSAFWCAGAFSYVDNNSAESFGLYSKGVEFYHSGKLHEAKDILEKAVSLDPDNTEAQTYLDLVNAELSMRSKGILESYEKSDELKREADVLPVDYSEPDEDKTEGVYSDNPSYDRESDDYGDDNYGYKEPRDSSGGEDKIKTLADNINGNIAPSSIKGEYKMSLGFTSEDVIWKDANGDYNERNFRMIAHDFPKTNTFDTGVYDQFKLAFDTNENGQGLNFHSNITVDPWSFVGKTDKFTISSASGATDQVELELKYWSGNSSTINETVYTLLNGDSIALPEFKVVNGKITAITLPSHGNEFGPWATFDIPAKEIDFIFQPVRELWFDYNTDGSQFRFFPFGLENQAFSSDDPLGFSNHHIYWEASPWLDDWVPGQLNKEPSPDDFWRGKWSNSLSSFTRDSDLQRLTALRGVSFKGMPFDNTDLSMTLAAPKTLWQDYDSITAVPGAVRAKTQLTDNFAVGLIDTVRIGYAKEQADSWNNVLGTDFSYDLDDATNIVGEAAMSMSEYDRSNEKYQTELNGSSAHLGIKRETGFGDAKIAFTHMDEGFDPGLANYKETRKDLHWSRHISFKKPFEQFLLTGDTTMKYEDIDPFRIGDGIDVGRNASNFRLTTKEAFDGVMDNLIDYRYVRDSGYHKYIEGVFREENTFRFDPEWTSRLLFIYHNLPKTKGGIDPIKYNADTGEFLKNTAVEDGKDPSLSTYSLGVEYAPEEWISFFGIYENTNDYRFATGDYPNGLLNSTYFSTETVEGDIYRIEVPQLYSQGFFDQPPYNHFNIYRTGVSLRPAENLGIGLDFTKNDFKFAGGIDDNINHFGTTVAYKFNPRLVGFLKYTFSKAYDLYEINNGMDLNYKSHHNVFMKLNYTVTEYGFLTIEFGEGAFLSPVSIASYSPYGDFLPTLDTQHIVRVYYSGRF